MSALVLLLLAALPVETAEASHFRFGTIFCSPTGNTNEVSCTVRQAWRASAFSGVAVGANINSFTAMEWGDGTSDSIVLTVTSVSAAQDWFFGETTLTHQYSSAGSYTVGFDSCCRIFGMNNRSSASFDVFALIEVGTGNRNPTSTVPPILGVPQGTVGSPSTFAVPVTDPDADPFRCRLSTDSEAGGGPSPTGLTVNSNCTVEWDNAGYTSTQVSQLSTVQIIVEELDGSGNVVQTSPLDFLLQITDEATNSTPLCFFEATSPTSTGGAQNISVDVYEGQHLHIEILGQDLDATDVIELSEVSKPPFGNYKDLADNIISLPINGTSPLEAVFHADPVPGGLSGNTYFLQLSIFDGQAVSQCTATINVVDPPTGCGTPTIVSETPDAATRTVTVVFDANDPSGLSTIAFRDPSTGDPVLNNFTVIDSDGFTSTNGIDWEAPHGGSAPTQATFVLQAGPTGPASYWAIITNGCGGVYNADPIHDFDRVSKTFELDGNYPNPFNPTTTIHFNLPETMPVNVTVYDLMGREVKTLVDNTLSAGAQNVVWDARDTSGSLVPSGVYLYRVKAGAFVETRQMTLIK